MFCGETSDGRVCEMNHGLVTKGIRFGFSEMLPSGVFAANVLYEYFVRIMVHKCFSFMKYMFTVILEHFVSRCALCLLISCFCFILCKIYLFMYLHNGSE